MGGWVGEFPLGEEEGKEEEPDLPAWCNKVPWCLGAGTVYGGLYVVWCLLDCMMHVKLVVHGEEAAAPGGEGAVGGGVPPGDHQTPHGHRGQGGGGAQAGFPCC